MKQLQTREIAWPLVFSLLAFAAFVLFFRIERHTPWVTLLVVLGLGMFCLAGFIFFRVQVPPGRILVVPSGATWKTVENGKVVFSLKNVHLISITSRFIEISASERPYPLTSDGLPVSVTATATVVVKRDSARLMDIIANLVDKGEKKFYEEEEKALKALIGTLLSEWTYEDITAKKQDFEDSIMKRWPSVSDLHLQAVHPLPQQMDPVAAGLEGIDLGKAEVVLAEFRAKIKSDIAQAAQTGAAAEQSEKQAIYDTEVFEMLLANKKAGEVEKRKLAAIRAEIAIETETAARERSKKDTIKAKIELDREGRTQEAVTQREVAKIENELWEAHRKIEEARIELRGKELSMLAEKKDGDFRYQLALKSINVLKEQAEAFGKALANAKIIGSFADLPKLQDILKPSLTLLELIPGLSGLLQDGPAEGIARLVSSRAGFTRGTREEQQGRGPSLKPDQGSDGNVDSAPPNDQDFKP